MGFCSDLNSCIERAILLINPAIAVLSAIALALFLWGVVRFIYSSGESKGKIEGREMIIWGLIALTVLVSVWGIVILIDNTFFGGVGSAAGGGVNSANATGNTGGSGVSDGFQLNWGFSGGTSNN